MHDNGWDNVNCHAKGLIEQKWTRELTAPTSSNDSLLNAAWCSVNELESKFDGDMDAFVSHIIVKLFDKKFAKEMSQIGGLTLDRDAFADYFRSSNGKQLWVDKLLYIVPHLDGTKERKTKFRVWRDDGHAVYASWMRWFLGQEQAYRVFSTE